MPFSPGELEGREKAESNIQKARQVHRSDKNVQKRVKTFQNATGNTRSTADGHVVLN